MKKILYILMAAVVLSSCGSSRNSVANTPEDKALISAIKKLNKTPSNAAYTDEVKSLYEKAVQLHLNNIDVYNTLTDMEKWDKIIREYSALERISEIVNGSPAARKLINTDSFTANAEVAKQHAAADYYSLAESYLNEGTKESSRAAYYAFKKSLDFVPDYKDAKRQMQIAYENSVLNVVINPVTDNSYYYSSLGRNRF
jgi:hypothetical protein